MTTEDDEFNARVEAELDAALQAERVKRRAEIAARLRRSAAMAHLDKVNARHPIEGPGDPKFEAERRRIMDARAKADCEHMGVNSRPIPGAAVRGARASLTRSVA